MLSRKVELKRNSFLIFMLRVLPIIFWGGVLAIWAFRAFDSEISKWVILIFFVVAIVLGMVDLKNNKRVLCFSSDGIDVIRMKNNREVFETKIQVEDIEFVECSERLKNIYLVLKNSKRYELLKYNSAHMLGAEKFFIVKSELCRYFPNRAHQYIDNEVKAYIESGYVSEFVKSKEQTAKSQSIVLFIAELIFAMFPLGLSLIAVIWFVVKLIYWALSFIYFILKLF